MEPSADSGDQTFDTDADGSCYYSFEAETVGEVMDVAESQSEKKISAENTDVNTDEATKVPSEPEDAEASEADILYMPSMADVLNAIGEMDRQKTLVVEPVKPEDLPVIKMLIESAVCKNASLAFVRDKDEALHGMLTLSYGSVSHAEAAKVEFNDMLPDYRIENPPPTKSADTVMENWKKEHSYTDQLLASTMLIVKNLNSATTTVEQLRELFPEAANIVISAEPLSYIGKLKGTTHAYILYGSEQAASAAYESSVSTPVCLDDRQLIVRRYKELPKDVAPGYLKLSTRQLVLWQLKRADEFMKKARRDVTFELRARWPMRFKRATELIKEDDAARDSLGLPKPSLEELACVKRLSASKRAEVLGSLGLAQSGPGDSVKPADRSKIPKLFELPQAFTYSCNGSTRGRGIPSLTNLHIPGFSRPRGMIRPDPACMPAFRGRGWQVRPVRGMSLRMPMHRFLGPRFGMPPSMAQRRAMLLEQSLIDEGAFW